MIDRHHRLRSPAGLSTSGTRSHFVRWFWSSKDSPAIHARKELNRRAGSICRMARSNGSPYALSNSPQSLEAMTGHLYRSLAWEAQAGGP